MSSQSEQLQELRAQLHELNQEWARASAPLQEQHDLDGEQKKKLAADLRPLQARWEDLTRQIDELLHIDTSYLKDGPK